MARVYSLFCRLLSKTYQITDGPKRMVLYNPQFSTRKGFKAITVKSSVIQVCSFPCPFPISNQKTFSQSMFSIRNHVLRFPFRHWLWLRTKDLFTEQGRIHGHKSGLLVTRPHSYYSSTSFILPRWFIPSQQNFVITNFIFQVILKSKGHHFSSEILFFN